MARSFNNIAVFPIAQTTANREEVDRWLTYIGVDKDVVIELLESGTPDPALIVALAAKQCYLSFQPGLNPNITKVRRDMVEYLDNVLKQKHGSVFEHATFTFAIEGCSRVFTGEMNRHRAGVAISERSMRYVRYDNITYWLPECFRPKEGDSQVIVDKKNASQVILQRAFDHMQDTMKAFNQVWAEELSPESTFHAKKTLTSAFRRAIGMGIATGGIWTLNLRALRHVIALRTDSAAEEEIVHVCRKIGHHMMLSLPEIFGDFRDIGGVLIPDYWKV